MTTEPRPLRLSDRRYTDLLERCAALEARIVLLEIREDIGVIVAEEIGTAALRALKRRPTAQRKPTPLRGVADL